MLLQGQLIVIELGVLRPCGTVYRVHSSSASSPVEDILIISKPVVPLEETHDVIELLLALAHARHVKRELESE